VSCGFTGGFLNEALTAATIAYKITFLLSVGRVETARQKRKTTFFAEER